MAIQNYNLENAKAQMRKGTLDFSILLIISQGKVYATEIIQKLVEEDISIVEGTLYPLLSRLRRAGVVSHSWEESQSGPPRKYYTLTKEGKEVLRSLCNTWSTFNSSISALIKKYEKSN